MNNFLPVQDISILKEAHHSSLFRKNADRIKAIIFLNEGFSYIQTAKLLMLDEASVRRYEKEYEKSSVDGLLECRYHGSKGFLTTIEEAELIKHLKTQVYLTVKEVVAYVKNKYTKTYSIDGMTHLLHWLHFVYKKTKVIPGKLNREKREEIERLWKFFHSKHHDAYLKNSKNLKRQYFPLFKIFINMTRNSEPF